MRLRGLVKRLLYGTYPFYKGWFPYFGHAVHFPAGSHIFIGACAQGIYERETVTLLTALVEPNTTFIDIGANIGLLSIPVLAQNAEAKVVSVEASPDTFQHLRRTWEKSPHRDRWRIVESAVGHTAGEARFWASKPESGAFDGLNNTGRGGPKHPITVRVETIDQIWRDLECPPVSALKIDVEGGERDVLSGGREMIAQQRPALVIEWSRLNLPAYGIHSGELLDICRDFGYLVYAHPSLCLIESKPILDVVMTRTETFVLVPAQSQRRSWMSNALPDAR